MLKLYCTKKQFFSSILKENKVKNNYLFKFPRQIKRQFPKIKKEKNCSKIEITVTIVCIKEK